MSIRFLIHLVLMWRHAAIFALRTFAIYERNWWILSILIMLFIPRLAIDLVGEIFAVFDPYQGLIGLQFRRDNVFRPALARAWFVL